MAQFATSDDLETRLGLEFTEDEADRADALLELASGLIQDEARQQIELVSEDTLTLPGTSDDLLKLPQRPVVAVTSVTLDGVALVEGRDFYLDGNAIVRIAAGGALLDETIALPLDLSGFGAPEQTLEIRYTHGYEDPPPSVKAICIEAAVRVWVNPGGAARESVGDTYASYDSVGLMLTRDEKQVIRRLFGRAATSVTVGR